MDQMFCRQCEQTANGTGCTVGGVCGKTSETACLQDLVVYGLKEIAYYGNEAIKLGKRDKGLDRLLMEGLFTSVTNVNFDAKNIHAMLKSIYQVKNRVKTLFLKTYKKINGKTGNMCRYPILIFETQEIAKYIIGGMKIK